MHDLCLLKAQEKRLFRRVDNSTYQHRNPSSIDTFVTILAIIVSANATTLSLHLTRELEDIRSLLVIAKLYEEQIIHFDYNTTDFDKSRYLRILCLKDVIIKSKIVL